MGPRSLTHLFGYISSDPPDISSQQRYGQVGTAYIATRGQEEQTQQPVPNPSHAHLTAAHLLSVSCILHSAFCKPHPNQGLPSASALERSIPGLVQPDLTQKVVRPDIGHWTLDERIHWIGLGPFVVLVVEPPKGPIIDPSSSHRAHQAHARTVQTLGHA